MRTLLTLIGLLSAQACSAAGIGAIGDPGLSVCWAWNDPDDTVIDATPGSGNGAAVYAVEDGVIAAAGLDAGTWVAIPYIGPAGTFDPEVNERLGTSFVAQHRWSGTATLPPGVDVTAISGGSQSATDLKDFADAGYDPSTNKVEGIKLADLLTAMSGTLGTLDALDTAQDTQHTATMNRIGATGSGLTSLASQASVDDVPTAAENAAAVIGATAAGSAGTVGKILADYAAVKPATTIAAADDVEGVIGGGTPVDPDVIDDSRTWFATDARARNIVTVGDNFAGTFALQPDLNPGTTIVSVSSVSITGAATVTATDLQVNRAKTKAHFTVPTLTTTGTYTVVVTVVTIDGQTIVTTATLKVQ